MSEKAGMLTPWFVKPFMPDKPGISSFIKKRVISIPANMESIRKKEIKNKETPWVYLDRSRWFFEEEMRLFLSSPKFCVHHAINNKGRTTDKKWI